MHLDPGSYEDAFKGNWLDLPPLCMTAPHGPILKPTSSVLQKSLRLLTLKGISVEAEVGGIGGTEDGGVTARGRLADPEECAKDCWSWRWLRLRVVLAAFTVFTLQTGKACRFDQLQKIKIRSAICPLVLRRFRHSCWSGAKGHYYGRF